jgi:hypothetical protein
METVDIRHLYDSDPRPTFIVDCHTQPSIIFHVNAALYCDMPDIAISLHTHNALRDWWDPASRVASHEQDFFRDGRYRWAKFTACQRWLIITVEGCLSTEEPHDTFREPVHRYDHTFALLDRSDVLTSSDVSSAVATHYFAWASQISRPSTSAISGRLST